MRTVSGDTWLPSTHSPYVEGVEYFNYTNRDITITDRLGIEVELLRRNQDPFDAGDRGWIVIRLTKLVDPRRVNLTSEDAIHDIDKIFLEQFKVRLEEARGLITNGLCSYNQNKTLIQVEVRLRPESEVILYKSNMLGITIRESEDYSARSSGNSPEGYIKDEIIPELKEWDRQQDDGKSLGIRTLFSARLIDNHHRLGVLWTCGFGEVTRVMPVQDEEQPEGLYLAGGFNLSQKQFIPIEDLLDPKKLLAYNLHRTELDAKKNSTGEYTSSVITERDKYKKDNKDLRSKLADLESKALIDKINKAHSDFKQTVTMENLKENNANNVLGTAARILATLLASIKTLLTFFNVIKAQLI